MNFRYKLMQFLSGRNGPDKLLYGITAVAFVLAFINIFARLWALQLAVYGLLIYALFRCFSRNIEARRRENLWFENKLYFLKRRRELIMQQRADKTHIYKRCPACKATLRLPHRIGKHKTVCPKCGREFKVTVRK